MELNIGTKVENEGKNSQGRLSAKEFNQMVSVIQQLVGESKTLKTFFGLLAGMVTSVEEGGFHFSDSTGKDVMNYTAEGLDAAKVSRHLVSLILSADSVTVDVLAKDIVGKISTLVSVEEEGYHFPDLTGKDVMNYTSSGLDAARVSEHFISLILKSGSVTTNMLASEIVNKIASLISVEEDGFHFPDSTGDDVMNYTTDGFDVAKVSDHFVQVLNQAGVTGSLEYDVINDNVYNF